MPSQVRSQPHLHSTVQSPAHQGPWSVGQGWEGLNPLLSKLLPSHGGTREQWGRG